LASERIFDDPPRRRDDRWDIAGQPAEQHRRLDAVQFVDAVGLGDLTAGPAEQCFDVLVGIANRYCACVRNRPGRGRLANPHQSHHHDMGPFRSEQVTHWAGQT